MSFKTLRVESDGDRYPKDVYLVNEVGERVATMETGFPFSEAEAFKAARAIVAAVNQLQKPVEV